MSRFGIDVYGGCQSSLYRPLECLVPTRRTFWERGSVGGGLKEYSWVELWEIFPWLSRFYAPFEKHFDTRPTYRFMRERGWIPILSVMLYGLMIVLLPRYTKKNPLNVKKPLAIWNLLLAVFSFIGAVRTVPHLLYWRATSGFRDTICVKPQLVFGDGATGLWCLLFTLSKVAELMDTFFVVAKGRTPIFLHWYHHVSVLLFTWATYTLRHSGLYFIAMNYTVHAAMYTYFFLMAVDCKPKWLNPMWITIMQISQMVVGVMITVFGFAYAGPSCPGQIRQALYFQGIMYGSYLYLFLDFMVRRFVFKAGKGRKGKGGDKEKTQ